MTAKYNIPQLIAMAAYINYKPDLAGAVNRLISAKNETEYSKALKEANEATLGYEVFNVYDQKDYGSNPNAHFAGLPIFQPITLDDGIQEPFTLPAAVVSLNRVKNIVVTQVQGRDVSVKEFINNGDWVISVSGILNTRGWEYPLEDVMVFNQFMERNQALKVSHEVLNNLGIFEIVVTDYSIPKSPHINCQPFSFNCVNDEPLPLTISDLPSNSFV